MQPKGLLCLPTFNTNVTSRLTAPGFSEALLRLLDTGDGTLTDTYNGLAGHPNVFQGQPVGANAIVWKSVPIDPSGQP